MTVEASSARWEQRVLDANSSLVRAIKWQSLRREDQRKKPVVVAILGEGIDVDSFSPYLAINEREIPNNGRDDDRNGYIDDYFGVDFSKGDYAKDGSYELIDYSLNRVNGTSYTRGEYKDHESKAASMVLLMAGFNSRKSHPVEILSLKTARADGGHFDYTVVIKTAKALDYAVQRGADVVSISYGVMRRTYDPRRSYFPVPEPRKNDLKILQEAIERATRAGVIIIASASNDRHSSDFRIPAHMNGVYSVSNHDFGFNVRGASRDIHTAFFGTRLNMWAPRENGGIANDSGASFATPLIAGAVALYRSRYPSLSPRRVMRDLKRSVSRRSALKSFEWGGTPDIPKFLQLGEK